MMKWIKRTVIVLFWCVTITYVYGIGALAGKFAPHLAELSMARSSKLVALFMGDYTPCGDLEPLACGFQDTTGRVEVDCADYQGVHSAVLLTFGQSNSANAGRDRYIPVGDVANFNFHDGKCYRAEDPLLGPDGDGGSVWGVLADKLIAQGHYERVLLAPFGIGGSSLAQWQPDGFLHPILQKATDAIRNEGIKPTHVLWHQGETDATEQTSEEAYSAMFEVLLSSLRSYEITAPVYPAIATHCGLALTESNEDQASGQESVRAAQMRLPHLDGVIAGPDTDQVQGELYRHDNCHFSAKGMQSHANLWLEALTRDDG